MYLTKKEKERKEKEENSRRLNTAYITPILMTKQLQHPGDIQQTRTGRENVNLVQQREKWECADV